MSESGQPTIISSKSGEDSMGTRIRTRDWSGSPLGVRSDWPQSLRTAVDLMAGSLQPMFIAWGAELTFLYNDAYAFILGGKHPEALGRPFRQVWSEIWPEISPLIDSTLTGESIWWENLHLVTDRHGFAEDSWYTFSYSPIRDEQDAVAGLFCACAETTATVLANRASQAERARLFEMTRDLFGVATYDGYLRTINPAWSRILGRTDEELRARPFAEIIHPDDLATTAEVIASLAKGEPVHQFHVRLLKADGSPVAFAWSAVPEGDPASDIFYTVGRDITEELRREETLRQNQKMEAIGHLTGGLAHDFNNLLQAVQGNLDLIRRRPDDAGRVARLADNAFNAAERGAKLTAQLLAFSRAQKLEIRQTDVRKLTDDIDDMLRRSLGPAIAVSVTIAEEVTGVLVDPTQLDTSILNLAINARDAMPGGGLLTIEARRHDVTGDPELSPGRYIEIDVSDEGAGMTTDVAARAFDPFFTTKDVGGGTGLGLSQVYAMAKQAGGTARIKRTDHNGTTISLLLREADLIETPEEKSADDGLPPGLARRSVLVIDDDPDVRQFLADSLEALGLDVRLAVDGAAGIDAIEQARPDILLLDFAMPGLNGAQVADQVRAMLPELPIVFVTGYSDTAAIEAAVGAEAVLLKKPFTVDDLQSVLRRSLQLDGAV